MKIGVLFATALLAAAPAAAFAQAAPAQPSGPPPLEAYGKLPAIEHMKLSPSGTRFAFVAVTGEERRLFVRNVAGGDALISSKVGDTKVRGIEWAGDDFVLVTVVQTVKFGDVDAYWPQKEDRFEGEVVLCLNLKTGQASLIFQKAPKGKALAFKLVGGHYGYRQVGGRWFGYFGGVTAGSGDEDLYRVDLETGEGELVGEAGSINRNWVVGQDGSVLASIEYVADQQLTRIRAGDGGKELLTRKDPTGAISIGGIGSIPGSFILNDQSGDRDVVSELSVASPANGKQILDDEVVEEDVRDPISGQLLGVLTDHDRGVWFDPKLEARYKGVQKAFGKYHVTLESWSQNLDKVIAFTDGADDAGTYWLVDMTTGKASELVEAHPEVRPEQVGSTQMISYKAEDGMALTGLLTLPPNRPGQKLPLVVMPHGGPLGTREDIKFDWWAQAFASRGYAVFQPNFRGSDGAGAAFRNASVGEYGHKMIFDISDGVAALAEKGVIDKSRVCVVGASYGGYAALAGVTLQHNIYRCAVSVAGVSDPGAFLFRAGDKRGITWNPDLRELRQIMGASFAGDSTLRAIAPVYHAAGADVPILLIHGEDDTVVKPDQSDRMANALKQAGGDVDYMKVPSLDHHLSTSATRLIVLKASVDFVMKNNPPN